MSSSHMSKSSAGGNSGMRWNDGGCNMDNMPIEIEGELEEMPEELAIAAPATPTDVAVIERQAATEISVLVETAQALVVSNPQQAETAADFRAQIVARRKRIEDWFAPMTSAAHAAWKALTTRRAGAIEGYAEAEQIVSGKLTAFHMQERAARAAAERAAAELARQAAEEKQLAAALAAG